MKKLPLIFLIALIVSCHESDVFSEGRTKSPKAFKGYSGEVIREWNKITQKTMQGPQYNPLMATRIMAMVHIAMHDALNNIAAVYDVYALDSRDKKADPVSAAASAAHTILTATFPEKKTSLDSALQVWLLSSKTKEGERHGLVLGKKAADAVLALRDGDGAFQDPIGAINNPSEPGLYQPVPPTPFAFAPFWKDLKPFGLSTPSQFRVAPMPLLHSAEYLTAYNEVKAKGIKDGSARTPDENNYAHFWYEFSEIGWNTITHTVVVDRNVDLLNTARIFALVNIALADSYIAGWDSKFHYNFWRPYTAVRAAETDGNNDTQPNANWDSLLPTPPVHDYPSTHSTLGNAAATVLASYFGDNTTFTFVSGTALQTNRQRTFQSFSQAAQENADSRVMAGLHFRFSCDGGMFLGEKIGTWVVENKLTALKNNKSL